jgi:hypothetical protein
VLVVLSSSRREIDELKLKAAVLEAKNMAAAALFLEAQEQVENAMEEASVAPHFLSDVLVTNTTEITEDPT